MKCGFSGPLTALAEHSVAYNAAGTLLVGGYVTGTLWTTATWTQHASLLGPAASTPQPFGIQSVEFSGDGRRVIVAYDAIPAINQAVVGFNTDDGSIAWRFQPRAQIGGIPRVTTGIYRLGLSARVAFATVETVGGPYRDPQRFARVVILDTNTGRTIRTIDNIQVDRATARAVSKDGDLIATATDTGEIQQSLNLATHKSTELDNRDPIRIWNARTGALGRALPAHAHVWALAFSADGHYLFESETKSPWATLLRVWDVTTGDMAQTIAPNGDLMDMAVSPDGSELAAVGSGLAIFSCKK